MANEDVTVRLRARIRAAALRAARIEMILLLQLMASFVTLCATILPPVLLLPSFLAVAAEMVDLSISYWQYPLSPPPIFASSSDSFPSTLLSLLLLYSESDERGKDMEHKAVRSGMTMAPYLLIQPNFQAITVQLILTLLLYDQNLQVGGRNGQYWLVGVEK